MPTRKVTAAKPRAASRAKVVRDLTADELQPSDPPLSLGGATSGVMAPGAVGRAAREAAHKQFGGGTPPARTPDRPRDR